MLAPMARTKAKDRTQFLCRECGSVQPKWAGRCPDCGAWDALDAWREPREAAARTEHEGIATSWAGDDPAVAPASAAAVPILEIEAGEVDRWPTGIGELDRVLRGGIVPGSVTLLGGEPGIGKSTLLLQAAVALARSGRRILYASSEESAQQVALRADRLIGDPDGPDGNGNGNGNGNGKRNGDGDGGAGRAGLERLHVLADTNLERIAAQARELRPDVCVIDSIQMVWKPDLDASPGSPAQLRRCCTELVRLAKISSMAVFVVGHVTKDGQLAGPKLLEHLVDAVLGFEGDSDHAHRLVRGVKNRFGTTLEVGLFEMTGRGLREVRDVGRFRDGAVPRPGSVVVPAMHGTRAIPVEIQALTATGILGGAKRKASGIDGNRLAMIIAVLEQHAGLRLADQDIFVQTVGGLRVVEPAADLAILLAIAGAHRRRALPPGSVAVGEVGLGGEVRPVQHLDRRCREVARLGYARAALNPSSRTRPPQGLDLLPVADVRAALELLTARDND
jgi:DNA repair protein RadA/Sms